MQKCCSSAEITNDNGGKNIFFVQQQSKSSLKNLLQVNTIDARATTPLDSFAPTLLPIGRDPNAPPPKCEGLCPLTAQPGPDADSTSDPSSRMYVTFNEPIQAGPCFEGGLLAGPCTVTLTPQHPFSSTGSFTLSKIDEELVFAGETLAFIPPTAIKPFANYTVTIAGGLVQSSRVRHANFCTEGN